MQNLKFSISEIEYVYGELSNLSGFDLRNFAFSFKMHRAGVFFEKNNLDTIDDFLYRIKNSKTFLQDFLTSFFVPQSELFRDAEMWNYLNSKILPRLLSKSEVSIHIPECIFGEELYSLLLFLGMFKSDNISVTVSFPSEIYKDKIRFRQFSSSDIKNCSKNIELLENILNPEDIFRENNGSFKPVNLFRGQILYECSYISEQHYVSEFDLVLFRNRMIYYNKKMQDEVLSKINTSIKKGGYLITGEKENILKSNIKLKKVNSDIQIYKKRVF